MLAARRLAAPAAPAAAPRSFFPSAAGGGGGGGGVAGRGGVGGRGRLRRRRRFRRRIRRRGRVVRRRRRFGGLVMEFTKEQHEAVSAAIRAAEQNTSGQIVCVLARSSSAYAHIPILWASALALIVPWPLIDF